MKVGLFGGTFDPVHQGHIQLCHAALKRLALDRIWCIITPQNPLKAHNPTDIETRLAQARSAFSHPRIDVLSSHFFTQSSFTRDMVHHLQTRLPAYRFVWLMGADNLEKFHHWHAWHEIIQTLPIGVFARPPIQSRACFSRATKTYDFARYRQNYSKKLVTLPPPAWCYITMPLSALSSTKIRAERRLPSAPPSF